MDAIALLFVALDQAVLDGGHWDVAWLFALLEETPMSVFFACGSRAQRTSCGRPRPSCTSRTSISSRRAGGRSTEEEARQGPRGT
eukprot:14102147-Heterocapsa_arctica.AAC.1